MTLLVGYDGSDGARDAVALATRLGEISQSDFLLIDVLPLDDLLADPYLLSSEQSPGSEDLFRDPLRALAGREVDTRTFTDGSPARAIQALAEQEQVELIVIGSPHRGAVGRTLIGSVGESLLHGATRPVVVAPRGYADREPGQIGLIAVAYDGSAEAKLALSQARALARAASARLRVLTVAAPAMPMPGGAGYAPLVGFDAEAVIEEAIAAVGPTVPVAGRRLAGPPAIALAEACEDGIDLLVTGSRGYGPLGRLFVGSVCSRLIRIAPCPVLVVPRAKGQDAPVAPAEESKASGRPTRR